MFIPPHRIFAAANSDGDPIILSRLDCDVYKPIMGQFIWAEGHADVPVTFALKVRTKGVKLGRVIPEAALREQLDALQKLSFTETELSQLGGMTITNKEGVKRHMFSLAYLDELRRRPLPPYTLQYLPNGEIDLRFTGPWLSVTFWETPAMAILSELYYWHLWKKIDSQATFSAFYAELYLRQVRDCKLLAQYPGLTFAQFGHRRRHSRLIEVQTQELYEELLPRQCTAPSNMWLAFKMGQNNPKGTLAHEMVMVWATLNDNSDEWILRSPYDMVDRWYNYTPELAILLPDGFGTTAFMAGASPDLVRRTLGIRIDSKPEHIAIPEGIAWFKQHGEDPKQKIFIPSDGLTAEHMIDVYERFSPEVGTLTFGYGTNATNQINGILPPETGFHTLSMVIKVVESNRRPTVKLSDNPNKHTGNDPKEIERYVRLFGTAGDVTQATIV
jgi:nicotinate phosphoribosyltransferase